MHCTKDKNVYCVYNAIIDYRFDLSVLFVPELTAYLLYTCIQNKCTLQKFFQTKLNTPVQVASNINFYLSAAVFGLNIQGCTNSNEETCLCMKRIMLYFALN